MNRKYEISGNGDYIFTSDTKIINNGNTICLAFVGLTDAGTHSVNVNCDGDETKILSYEIIEKSSKVIINVQCSSNTTKNFVTCNLTDIYRGSINPNKPVQSTPQIRCGTQPEQPSIMEYKDWCGTCRK